MTTYKTGVFAKKAGVTVRSIQYYDRIGLLKPSARTEAGLRVYADADFMRLQQISTLKYIVLSLAEIKTVLSGNTGTIGTLLEKQRDVLQEKAQRIKFIIGTINDALNAPVKESDKFLTIIKAVTMNNQFDWFNKFYSDDDKKKLSERAKNWTPEDQKKIEEEWNTLFTDVRAHMDKPLDSSEVQALVDRWDSLIGQFTGGDPGISTGLNNAYANIDEAPQGVQEWTKGFSDVAEFINKARDSRKK